MAEECLGTDALIRQEARASGAGSCASAMAAAAAEPAMSPPTPPDDDKGADLLRVDVVTSELRVDLGGQDAPGGRGR